MEVTAAVRFLLVLLALPTPIASDHVEWHPSGNNDKNDFTVIGISERSFCARTNVAIHDEGVYSEIFTAKALNWPYGSVVQFDLAFEGCSSSVTVDPGDFDIKISYHKDGTRRSTAGMLCETSTACEQEFAHPTETRLKSDVVVFSEAGLTQGWQRVTLPIRSYNGGEVAIQVTADSITFGIDNLVIGDGCLYGCNGKGSCSNSVCDCDANFQLVDKTCIPRRSLPQTFAEDFNDDLSANWTTVGLQLLKPSTASCPSIGEGTGLVFQKSIAERYVITSAIDTSQASMVEFELSFGSVSGQCVRPSQSSEGLVVGVSTNGGLSFKKLSSIWYRTNDGYWTAVLSASVRSRWAKFIVMQPSFGLTSDAWLMDNLYVGPPQTTSNMQLNLDGANANIEQIFPFSAPGVVEQYCGKTALRFPSGSTTLRTAPFSAAGSFVQFDLISECDGSAPSATQYVDLKVASNLDTFEVPVDYCNPVQSSSCSDIRPEYFRFSMSRYSGNWQRITYPLPSTGTIRLSLETSPGHNWAISNFFIGNACPNACGGFGMCVNGTCVCDSDYSFDSETNACVANESINPTYIREEFEDEIFSNKFSVLTGGATNSESEGCGKIRAGRSLTMNQAGQRMLMTRPLDVRNGGLVEFTLRMGGGTNSQCRSPNGFLEYIGLFYSTNNGASWIKIDLSTGYFINSVRDLKMNIPMDARSANTRFLLWQPVVASSYGYDVWAIDDLYVGWEAKPTELDAHFGAQFNRSFFRFFPLGDPEASCASVPAMEFVGSGESSVTTVDVDLTLDVQTIFQPDLSNFSNEDFPVWSGLTATSSSSCTGGVWALFFESSQPRHVQTKPLNIDKPNLSFRFKIGVGPGQCDGIEQDSERVKLQYRTPTITDWTDIALYDNTEVTTVVSLPEAAISTSSEFRWIQDSFTNGGDVWYVAEISITFIEKNAPYLQYSINTACDNQDLAKSVEVQISQDGGSSWASPTSSCSSSCDTWQDFEGASYTNNYNGWRREGFPLLPVPSLRFRAVGNTVDWAIANLYIGYNCPNGCHGRGTCRSNGCECDAGYKNEGTTCVVDDASYPKELRDSFEGDMSLWQVVGRCSLEAQNSGCGPLADGTKLVCKQSGHRWMETADLDLRVARYIQFRLQQGSGSSSTCSRIDDTDDEVFVSFTVDNGLTYKRIQKMNYWEYRSSSYLVLTLPDAAQQNGVRIAWNQRSFQSSSNHIWSLDDVYIGPSRSNPATVDIQFGNVTETYLRQTIGFHLSATLGTFREVPALNFQLGFAEQYIETLPLDLADGSYIQFSVSSSASSSYQLELQLSTNYGASWQTINTECNYHDNECASEFPYYPMRGEELMQGWIRVTVFLPTSNGRRYRVKSTGSFSWSMKELYIGNECPNACDGHGFCHNGECKCDQGYFLKGNTCVSINTLPSTFRETFSSNTLDGTLWEDFLSVGGRVEVSVIAEGSSMSFYLLGGRRLTTTTLDLRNATFVEVTIQQGVSSSSYIGDREDQVGFYYSANGGMTWSIIQALDYWKYRVNSEVVVFELPTAAKTDNARLMWMQASMASGAARWSLDNMYLSNKAEVLTELQETFASLPTNQLVFTPNGKLSTECDGRPSLRFDTNAYHEFLVTPPINIVDGTLSVDISIGCGTTSLTREVTFEYSINNGLSYSSIGDSCEPWLSSCTTWYENSAVAIGEKWRRFVFFDLPKGVLRFKIGSTNSASFSFYVSRLSITSRCPNACGGHGYCLNGQCLCDPDYSESEGTCVRTVPAITSLTENFEDGIYSTKWAHHQGGAVTKTIPCSQEHGGFFYSSTVTGIRRLVTVPMDVNSANTYIQFSTEGGESTSSSSCRRGDDSEDNLIVSYSTNGGLIWKRIAKVDYWKYQRTSWMYVLPRDARTQDTIFMFSQESPTNSVMMIDDIEIRNEPLEPRLALPLNTLADLSQAAFVNGGVVTTTSCFTDPVLIFGSSGLQALETRPLQLGIGSYIQFEAKRECSSSSTTRIEIGDATIPGGSLSFTEVDSECGDRCYLLNSGLYPTMIDEWTRVTILLSDVGLRKFRFGSYRSSHTPWAMRNLYIGNDCPNACNGHGLCHRNSTGEYLCDCDRGFENDSDGSCVPKNLPNVMKEEFSDELLPSKWTRGLGGSNGPSESSCPVISDDVSFQANDAGVRWLETTDFDLSQNARYVLFSIAVGGSSSNCDSPSTSEPVHFLYSTNGGTTWEFVTTYYSRSSVQKVIHTIGSGDRTSATRYAWVQEGYQSSGTHVWQVDDVFIGPGELNDDKVVFDDFDLFREDDYIFMVGNPTIAHYCDSASQVLRMASANVRTVTTEEINPVYDPEIFMDGSDDTKPNTEFWTSTGQIDTKCGLTGLFFDQDSGERILTTKEFDLRGRSNLRMTFTLSFGFSGCDGPETNVLRDEDVHLEYSVVSSPTADSWQPLATYTGTSSLLYSSITLPESIKSATASFRWIQREYTQGAGINQDLWGISDIDLRSTPTPNFMLSFDLSMGCSWSNIAQGLSVSLLNLPSRSTVDLGFYPRRAYWGWHRVTFDLGILSSPFQIQFSSSIEFAIDNLYVGPACSGFCNGHGICTPSGACSCDAGYSGEDCSTAIGNPSGFQTKLDNSLDSESNFNLLRNFFKVVNAELPSCDGLPVSFIETHDLNTVWVDTISVTFKRCDGSATQIKISASVDGGLSWNEFDDHYTFSSNDMTEKMTIPPAARSEATRFRITAGSGSPIIVSVSVGTLCLTETCTDSNSVCVAVSAEDVSCPCASGFLLDSGKCLRDPCADVFCVADECQTNAQCVNGECQFTPKPDESVCNDDDARTTGDRCLAGECIGSTLCTGVQCDPENVCQELGRCDINTGECVPVFKTDGEACDDGNNRTIADQCYQGQCVGSRNLCLEDPCPPISGPDRDCKVQNCLPLTRACIVGAVSDGVSCDNDDDPATISECKSGICVTPSQCDDVTCTSSSSCVSSTCNPTTGVCEEVDKADFSVCGEVSSCFKGECVQQTRCTLQSCTPFNECHTAGLCNDVTGICSNPRKSNGATCSLGECIDGECVEKTECSGVICEPSDDCHVAGVCVVGLGCTQEQATNGTTCDPGNPTQRGSCQGGVCVGMDKCEDVVCPAEDIQCYSSSQCDPFLGECTRQKLIGTSCDDGNAQTLDDICTDTGCIGVLDRCERVSCPAEGECFSDGICSDGQCSSVMKPNGTSCDSGLGTCRSGVCVLDSEVCENISCPQHSTNPCKQPECSAASNGEAVCGFIPAPVGSRCDDGIDATINDVCDANQFCQGENLCDSILNCTSSNPCVTSTCDPNLGVCKLTNKPDNIVCDDFLFNTVNDVCKNGVCTGTLDKCLGTVCPAAGQCQDSVTCVDGDCQYTNAADNTPCDDGVGNADSDVCLQGACVDLCASVTCDAPGLCQQSITCVKGVCEITNFQTGVECDDGNPDTKNDKCNGSGLCIGESDCEDVNCVVGQCQVAAHCVNGKCAFEPAADDTSCGVDSRGTCLDGVCQEYDPCDAIECKPPPCILSVVCLDGNCVSTEKMNDDTPCDDGNSDTISVCKNGVCVGTLPDPCMGVTCESGCGTATCFQGTCFYDQQCTTVPVAPTTQPETATTVVTTIAATSAQSDEDLGDTSESKGGSSDSNLLVIIAIVCVALVCIVFAIVFGCLRRRQEQKVMFEQPTGMFQNPTYTGPQPKREPTTSGMYAPSNGVYEQPAAAYEYETPEFVSKPHYETASGPQDAIYVGSNSNA